MNWIKVVVVDAGVKLINLDTIKRIEPDGETITNFVTSSNEIIVIDCPFAIIEGRLRPLLSNEDSLGNSFD